MELFKGILLAIIQACTFGCYFPQIIKTIRTKESEDVAVSSWVISMISTLCYLTYGMIVDDSFIVATCLSEAVLAVISVLVLLKYK